MPGALLQDARTSVYTSCRVTLMLPRVAFEYGHTMWARSIRAWASSAGTPGRLMFSCTSMPKPVGYGPIPTLPSTDTSGEIFSLSRAATNFIAPRKQAE